MNRLQLSRLARSFLLLIPLLLIFSWAGGATADTRSAGKQVYSTEPSAKPDGTRWRIGYMQSGDYGDYPLTLAAVVEGLEKLGWLTLENEIPSPIDGGSLWSWLTENTRSDYLEFVPDARWQPGNFDADQRPKVRQAIEQRIKERGDIDLIIGMGTWAGQDLRALGPPVPTIIGSTSDPIGARIADSAQDSGRDNLHTRIEPERYQRQVRLFHEIVGFRSLGIVFENSEAGRTYAAVSAVQQVAAERGFTVVECHAPSSSIELEQAITNAVDCYRSLAAKRIDAVYVTTHRGVTSSSIATIANTLERARIPSFSMAGSRDVAKGILLSLAQADVSYVGLFHAETIARIFNGALPRQLSQLWIDPPKIALNLGTARAIGFDPPVDILLAADEVYEGKTP
jgi:ABC-type uncharacterized transport system substrate-binding protein